MKQSSKISLCAVCSALATVIMLVSYFPYLTYAVPAVAGLCVMIPLMEISPLWALYTYLVSAVLSLFFAEPESKFIYIFLCGFYPILKALIERIHKMWLEWIIKLAIFEISLYSVFKVTVLFTDISYDDIGGFGKYGIIAFIILCNIVFVLYDIAISRVSMFYIYRIRPKIKKYIK